MEVLWKDKSLYVENRQVSRLFKAIAAELARPFDRQDISDAIKACVERPADFVKEYLEENFRLQLLEEVPFTENSLTGQTQETNANSPIEGGDGPTSNLDADLNNFASSQWGVEDKLQEPVTPDDTSGHVTGKPSATHAPRPFTLPKPKFIELCAKSMGYETVGESDRVRHPDGSWLQKTAAGPFHFDKYGPSGQLVQSYLLKNHCLMKSPLNLDAAVWSLCQNSPEKYTLILADPDGHPIELRGEELMQLVKSGRIKLYPAEYRLSYEKEHL
jgi:hypothetical protein